MYDHVGLIASNLTVWNSAYPGKGGTYDHLRMLTGRVPFRGHNTLMLEWKRTHAVAQETRLLAGVR